MKPVVTLLGLVFCMSAYTIATPDAQAWTVPAFNTSSWINTVLQGGAQVQYGNNGTDLFMNAAPDTPIPNSTTSPL